MTLNIAMPAVCDDRLGPHGGGRIAIDDRELDFRVVDPYVGEIVDFANAVRDHRAPEVDRRGGMRNVAHLVAAVE